MHICPQEVMMVFHSIEMVRPLLPLVKMWCASCFDGTHKSCDDHAVDQTHSPNLAHE